MVLVKLLNKIKFMEIKINKDYKITTDTHNYILWKKCSEEQPKQFQKKSKQKIKITETWRTVGFFGDLEILYENLIEDEIKLLDAKSFREVIKSIKELKSSICLQKDTNFKSKK